MSLGSKLVKVALVLVVAAGLLSPASLYGGSAAATVSITATVDPFAEWADNAPVIAAGDWSGHITAVNQTRTVTKGLTLLSNVTVTVTPTAGANGGTLTHPTLASQTLATAYQLQGDVTVPDAAYKTAGAGAGQFFNAGNTYTVTHVAEDGTYSLSLLVRAVSGAVAPDADDYTCGVVLTASW